MSLWDGVNNWADSYAGCAGANQSPIDLSQSAAEPCDLLCSVTWDTSYPTLGVVAAVGDVLTFALPSSTPTLKYNNDTYTFDSLQIYHPTQHTVEGVRYDAEVVMVFLGPSGAVLNVSVLASSSPRESGSRKFFGAFVQYANDPTRNIDVNLGNNWSLTQVLPTEGSYFVYSGSDILPPCDGSRTWIVYRMPVNIHPDDLATLTKTYPTGYRPTQPLGEGRKVYYNDGTKAPIPEETLDANDDRIYIKCHRLDEDADIQAAKSNPAAGATLAEPPKLGGAASLKAMDVIKSTQDALKGTTTDGVYSVLQQVALILLGIAGLFVGLWGGPQLARLTEWLVDTIRGFFSGLFGVARGLLSVAKAVV